MNISLVEWQETEVIFKMGRLLNRLRVWEEAWLKDFTRDGNYSIVYTIKKLDMTHMSNIKEFLK